jgi:uncharacterized membrane protein YdjX (TVP38/TMEM64 family)
MPSYEKIAQEDGDVEALQKDNGKMEENKDDVEKKGSYLICCIIVISIILFVGIVDSFTTTYARRSSIAFAKWSIENAPWSFAHYVLIIIILICCCLPYGPLSVLMGAVFSERYGFEKGVALGVVCLFCATMVAAVICFLMARHNFKDFVQRKMTSNPKLSFLRNLDRLIVDGQGFEMVLLIRLAPLPTGPTQYFLGTTSVKWRDFIGGNACTNMLFALSDILIGAGATSLKKDNVVGMICFCLGIIGFFLLICYVGMRAKNKLEHLDRREKERMRVASLEMAEELDDALDYEEKKRIEKEEELLKHDISEEMSDTGIYAKKSGSMRRWESMESISASQIDLAVTDAPLSDEDLRSSKKINGRRI